MLPTRRFVPALFLLLTACGGGSASQTADTAVPSPGTSSGNDAGPAPETPATTPVAPARDAGLGPTNVADATASADANAPTPVDLPKPAGACPEFRAGELVFNPPGGARTVTVSMSEAAQSKSGPLIFYWYATGSSVVEAQVGLPLPAVLAAGGIVVAPQDVPGAGTFPWLRNFDQHDALFDEVLACALQKTRIDPRRVHAVGFSAGALMTTQLSFVRANYLASVATYSGGTDQPFAMPMHNKFAAMIMTGGPRDIVVQDFFKSSQKWETTLKQAGHFTVFCDHGGSHTIPKALVPGVWQFFLDHPFGQTVSPYAGHLPAAIAPPCRE